MFNNQQSQQDEAFPDMKSMVSWLVFVCRIGAVTLEVFLRKGFGSRYIGTQALLACLLILFWSMGWEGYDVKELIYFLCAYLGMVVVARLGVAGRYLRGNHPHSYYSGTPHLMALVPWMKESTVKRGLEPLVGFLAGVFLCGVSQPLGTFLMFAAVCMYLSVGIDEIWQHTRAVDMNDAVMEQEALVGRFRELRGRQWR